MYVKLVALPVEWGREDDECCTGGPSAVRQHRVIVGVLGVLGGAGRWSMAVRRTVARPAAKTFPLERQNDALACGHLP